MADLPVFSKNRKKNSAGFYDFGESSEKRIIKFFFSTRFFLGMTGKETGNLHQKR